MQFYRKEGRAQYVEQKSWVVGVFTQALWLSTQWMSPRKLFKKHKCLGPTPDILNQSPE